MVDEVEITNVGNGGTVASEETLARLADSIAVFAKKSGVDPQGEVAKAQKAYGRALKEDVESIKKKIDAQEDYTAALRRSTGVLSGMFNGAIGLLSGGLGIVTDSMLGFADTIISGDDSLSGLVSNFPIFGSMMARATRIVDDTVESFQTLSKVGATFSYDLGDLRIAARESRMSLQEYTNFVSSSSEKLAAFGGTVTGGARAVSGLVDSLDDELEQQLLSLGLSFEDINDSLANYLYLERGNARLRAQSEAEQARVASEYAKSLMTLNKLTGEDIQAIQERIAAEQRDFAFQRALSRMSEDERENIQEAYTNVAATLGPEMAQIFKARIINEGIIPPDLAPQFAAFSGTIAQIDREIARARTLTATEYGSIEQQAAGLSRIITTQLQEAENLGSILDVGAIVGEGVPAALLETINNMRIDPAQLLTDGVVDPDKVTEVITQAIQESVPPEGGAMNAFAEFQSALGSARLAIEENLITPFAEDILVPALNSFTSWISGFTEDNGEGSQLDSVMSFFNEKITAMGSAISTFLDEFSANPEQAITDAIADIGNFFRDAIFGQMVDMDPRDIETDMQRQGGLIQTMIDGFSALFENDGLIQSLKDGAKTAMSGMATGFTEFWNDPASNQLREDIKSMFSSLINVMQDTFVNSFLARKILGIDRAEVAERQLEQTGPTTSSAAENFGKAIFEQLQSRGARAGGPVGSSFTSEELTRFYETLGEQSSELFRQQMANNRSLMDRARGLLITGLEEGTEIKQLANLAASGEATQEQLDLLREIYKAGRETGIFNEIQGYNNGTKGFEDFGKGTLAMLHGQEAVIPLDSPLGRMINRMNSGSQPDILDSFVPNISSTLENAFRKITDKLEIKDTVEPSIIETAFGKMMDKLESVPDANESLQLSLNESMTDLSNNLDLTTLESAMSNLSTTFQDAAANQGTTEAIQELNTTMMHVLAVLKQTKTIDETIANNTKSIGGNIANGRISNIR